MIPRLRSWLAVAIVLFAGIGGATAQTVVWTGFGTNANWTTAANWQGSIAPANDGTAQILFGPASRTDVTVNAAQSVKKVTFDFTTSSDLSYSLSGTTGVSLTLGSDGLDVITPVSGSEPVSVTLFSSLNLVLGAAQTWSTTSDTAVHVASPVSGSGTLTLNGAGYVGLSGNNTYTGGTVLMGGALGLDHDSALGTGSLTVNGVSSLFSNSANRSISNAINLNANALNLLSYGGTLTFTGNVTLGANTTLNNTGQTVYFNGNIGETGGARALTVNGTNAVVLSGNNTYTGGSASYGGALMFRNAASVPATGLLSSSPQGYIGAGFTNSVQAGFIAKFDPVNTFGTIGFDTDPSAINPAVFTDDINLTGFTNQARLGSATRAILRPSSTLTPASGAGYRFGGGGGTLTVDAQLTGSQNVTGDSAPGTELTVLFTKTSNNYSGTTSATHTALVFETGAASPNSANGSYTMGTGGYIGTQDLALLPSLWISRFSNTILTGVIGFDTNNVANPITVGSILTPINLSQFTGTGTSIAIGTTSAAILAGTITLPSGQTTYHLTGYKGGWLQVNSSLTGNRSVRIGDANGLYPEFDRNDFTRMSTVFLNGSNSHTGGTFLSSGRLVIGDANALGTGALTVTGSSTSVLPRLETSMSSNPTFTNSLVAQSAFEIGGVNPLTWSGNLTNSGTIYKYGTFNLTLSGNNTGFSGGFFVNAGTLTFASDTAAGTGKLDIGGAGGIAAFTSASPTLGGLESNTTSSQVQLGSGTTLTINQTTDTLYRGQITGSGALVKAGSGVLKLESASTYTGGTTIAAGTVNISANTALGNGTVTLNGTTSVLRLESGVTLANPIAFGGAGGVLAGQGTLSSAIALGTNSGISPGNSAGLLSFSNGLTWGPGGFFNLEIQNATGSMGTGWDAVQVTGGLTFSSTLGAPFTLNLISLDGGGAPGVPANFIASNSYSWQIASATNLVNFNPNAISFNTSGLNSVFAGGTFSLSTSSNNLFLNFTPVPEPSTWALLITGAGVVAFTHFRRRRAR